VRIVKYIRHECIIFPLEGASKTEVIRALARKVSTCVADLPEEEIFRVIEEREALGTTAIGGGIAIPHAKIVGLDELLVVAGISPEGVPFNSLDGKPVYVIFLLLAPEEATTSYLGLLAKIARLLKDRELIKRLSGARDPMEIFQMIQAAENRSYGVLA